MGRPEIAKAILVTYELVGQSLSDEAAKTILDELSAYPENHVFMALTRCRKELRKLTLADILDRIPSGHPGVEEAWGLVSALLGNEEATVVWTDEMREAYGAAVPLKDDLIAARMAFKEVYSKAMGQARADRKAVAWKVSLGLDPHGRQAVIEQAVELGRLKYEHAQKLIPDFSMPSPPVEALALRAAQGF